jgi:hypothetical protein
MGKRVRSFLHHRGEEFSDARPVKNEDCKSSIHTDFDLPARKNTLVTQADSLPTSEARFGERDAREIRRREKAARDIAALPTEEQPAARDLELEMTRKFDLDRELLHEARNSALLGLERKAEGSGTSDSGS